MEKCHELLLNDTDQKTNVLQMKKIRIQSPYNIIYFSEMEKSQKRKIFFF